MVNQPIYSGTSWNTKVALCNHTLTIPCWFLLLPVNESTLATTSFAHSSSQNHQVKVLLAGTENFDSKYHIDRVLVCNAEINLPTK